MTARLAYKELTALTDSINQFKKSFVKRKNIRYSDRDCLLVYHWKQYLQWENSNPLGLDPDQLLHRLSRVYLYCVDMMQYFPHFYLDAFKEIGVTRGADGEHFLRMGLQKNPERFVLS